MFFSKIRNKYVAVGYHKSTRHTRTMLSQFPVATDVLYILMLML